MEVWKAVPDTDGQYWASDMGRIKRLAHITKDGKLRREKVLKCKAPNGCGYQQVGVFGQLQLIHVLVMAAHVGPKPEGMVILHGDDDPSNNCLVNLSYGTQSKNIQQAVDRGRQLGPNPERAARIAAVLSGRSVWTYKELQGVAADFGVCFKTVQRSWAKVRSVAV